MSGNAPFTWKEIILVTLIGIIKLPYVLLKRLFNSRR